MFMSQYALLVESWQAEHKTNPSVLLKGGTAQKDIISYSTFCFK